MCRSFSSFTTLSPGCRSLSEILFSLSLFLNFNLYILPYLILRRLACFVEVWGLLSVFGTCSVEVVPYADYFFYVFVGREGDFPISFLYHLKFSPHEFILYLNGVKCTFHICLGRKPTASWCWSHQGKHDHQALDGKTLYLGRPLYFLPLWIFFSFSKPFVLANAIQFSWPADFHLCLISFLWSS